jgi:hypothetical protein
MFFAFFIRWVVNGDFHRGYNKRTVPTHDEEEVKNQIQTGDNGEIRIFGRGSNRSNENFEYYVVMRPVNGEVQDERTVMKLDKRPNTQAADLANAPLVN